MSDEQKTPDVGVLEDRYQILGELRSGSGPRTYIGTRKSDGADVLIRIVRGTKDDNNALAHLASDAQILSRIDHPNVLAVLEGRWLGRETFALVNERVRGRTLEEMLSAGDTPPHQRASVVLDDVRSVLEWARRQGVVHRGVTPETLFFDSGSEEPFVLLSPTPIPLERIPDAREDARTIGSLSYAMLTGEAFNGSESADALSKRRPDLARRVIDETLGMVASRNIEAVPNVENYVAVIANADALHQGEIELARMQAEVEQERRKEREAFEAEQRACAVRIQEMEDRLATERMNFEHWMQEEGAKLADAHQQLAVEQAQLEQERIEFDQRSAELDWARAEVETIRAGHEKRVAEAVAAAVAATKAEMRGATPKKPSRFAIWGGADAAVERQAARPPLEGNEDSVVNDEPPSRDAASASRRERRPNDRNGETSKNQRRPDDVSLVGTGARDRSPRIVPPVGLGSKAVPETASDASSGDDWRHKPWILPAAIIGVLAVLIAIVIGMNHRANGEAPGDVTIGRTAVAPTPPVTEPGVQSRGGFLSQSAGGTLVPRSTSPMVPSGAEGAQTNGSVPGQVGPVSPWPVNGSVDTVSSSVAAKSRAAAAAAAATADDRLRAQRNAQKAAEAASSPVQVNRNSIFSLPTPPSAPRDSFVRPDTVIRRDTVFRRDTVRPDTGIRPRPDTLALRP